MDYKSFIVLWSVWCSHFTLNKNIWNELNKTENQIKIRFFFSFHLLFTLYSPIERHTHTIFFFQLYNEFGLIIINWCFIMLLKNMRTHTMPSTHPFSFRVCLCVCLHLIQNRIGSSKNRLDASDLVAAIRCDENEMNNVMFCRMKKKKKINMIELSEWLAKMNMYNKTIIFNVLGGCELRTTIIVSFSNDTQLKV